MKTFYDVLNGQTIPGTLGEFIRLKYGNARFRVLANTNSHSYSIGSVIRIDNHTSIRSSELLFCEAITEDGSRGNNIKFRDIALLEDGADTLDYIKSNIAKAEKFLSIENEKLFYLEQTGKDKFEQKDYVTSKIEKLSKEELESILDKICRYESSHPW